MLKYNKDHCKHKMCYNEVEIISCITTLTICHWCVENKRNAIHHNNTQYWVYNCSFWKLHSSDDQLESFLRHYMDDITKNNQGPSRVRDDGSSTASKKGHTVCCEVCVCVCIYWFTELCGYVTKRSTLCMKWALRVSFDGVQLKGYNAMGVGFLSLVYLVRS